MNQYFMSVDLVACGWRFFITNPRAVVLSVWMGVGGCGWPISSAVVRAGIAWREFMYRAPISASAADDMTALMIWAIFNMAPLSGGFGE